MMRALLFPSDFVWGPEDAADVGGPISGGSGLGYHQDIGGQNLNLTQESAGITVLVNT